MRLTWHRYRYYPYERELASREVVALLNSRPVRETDEGIEISHDADFEQAKRLTYFAGIVNGHGLVETVQGRLESVARSKKRQSTRYSVHGLHEYKGKFNPQVARAILNIFEVCPGDRVLDPFCGSGTTLVECAQIGALGYGTDANPLAVFLANAKLQALVTPAKRLREILVRLSSKLNRIQRWKTRLPDDPRGVYLQAWFDPLVLQTIEIINAKIREASGDFAPIFLAVASNLLRDYSLQDPNDLRIRRRKSPLPDIAFSAAFLSACTQALDRLEATQQVIGVDLPLGEARLRDVTTLNAKQLPFAFDAAITSPPYAMALPYIDTQRLSLVWLDLIPPERILELEAELIGSREIRGSNRRTLLTRLTDNAAGLPDAEAMLCVKLASALGPSDGFRRKAVPALLYRYFAAMQGAFVAIRAVMKPGARFALIAGHNHTVLGGVRYDFDTPSHLADIAKESGWCLDEIVPLQTYHRYGYHSNNAVAAETLVLLRNA